MTRNGSQRKPLALDQVHQGDCLDLLGRVPDGCVDLAFADPPFNIGYDYDTYDDTRPADDYLDWSRRWMGEVVRVLRPDGTFWLAIGDEYAAELKVLATRELGLVCRSWVVWYYTFGVNCRHKFSRSHAHLFHFVKNPESFTFNADTIRVPSARELVYGDKRADPAGRLPDDTWILRPQDLPEGFGADEDTWYFPRVCGTFKERSGWHGCQMPEQLLGRIIRASSHPGGTVLDPFAGSGTTLAVARKLGRSYLGCELSAAYAEKVRERLAAIQVGAPLEGAAEPLKSVPATKDGRRLEGRATRAACGRAKVDGTPAARRRRSGPK
jgi:site-specific DNA-methyltransferase (adenine-specific)